MSALKPKGKKTTFEESDPEGKAEQQGREKKARTEETLQSLVDSDTPSSEQEDTPQQQQTAEVFARLQAEEQSRRSRARTGEAPTRIKTEKKKDDKESRSGRRGRPRSRSRSRNRDPSGSRSRSRSGSPPPLEQGSNPATNVETDLVVEDASPRGLNPLDDSDLQQQQQQQPSNRNTPILSVALNPLGIQPGTVSSRRQVFGPPGSFNAAQMPAARGSDDDDELTKLQEELKQMNATLLVTKTSDDACKKALQETKDALEACRKALEVPRIPDQVVRAFNEMKRNLEEAVKAGEEKDRLINAHAKASEEIEKERINHRQELDKYEEKLKAEKQQASTIAGELNTMSVAYANCQRDLQGLQDQVNNLRSNLAAEVEDKKNLETQLEAERKERTESVDDLRENLAAEVEDKQRIQNQLQTVRERVAADAEEVEKIKARIFWDILINTAFPTWQWEKLRRALKIKSGLITLENVKARMQNAGWSPELLKEALGERKAEQEKPASMDVVLYEPSDAKDSTELVSRSQSDPMDGDCWEELEKSKKLSLALEKKLEQLRKQKDTEETKLKDDISRLNERLYALRQENENLKNTLAQNPLDDAKARLKALDDCDNDRAELRRQLTACGTQRDKLQADLDQCREKLKKALDSNYTFLDIQNDLKAAQAVQAKCEEDLKKAMAANDTFVNIQDELKAEKKARAEDRKDFEKQLELATDDFELKKQLLTNMHSDSIEDEQNCRQELKDREADLIKCKQELQECFGAKDVLNRKFQGLSATAQKSIALRNDEAKMVAFMNSFIQNLTTRANDVDARRLQKETDLQIAEARTVLAEFKLEDAMRSLQRSMIQLRAREAEQIRLVETLRRTEWEKGEAERREAKAKDLKLDSQIQSREQILLDANKMVNKTACNFIEDSLEYLISGSPYVASGLSGRAEKKEAAMFYIHALCAEPHWAFLVARYLGKDYNMAYPLSAHMQLVLMDESEQYRARVGDRYDRIHPGWFSTGRRAKVIRVLNAFIIDMHYHRGMRERRRNHGRPLDTVDPKEMSVGLPDAAWVMERIGFWTVPDAKEMYSDEERVAVATEIIRAYQIFDLFDLDTSAPPVEIGWQAFLTDGDTQSIVAELVSRMVHKRVDGKDHGHELIWGTIRNNTSLLRYWRYEYPEPLVLLLPLWNYIMHVLDNGLLNPPFKQETERMLQAHPHLRDFFQFLPQLKQKLVQE